MDRMEKMLSVIATGKCRSRKEAAVKAGYSESYVNSNRLVHTKGYQEKVIPFLEKLKRERERAIDALAGKNPEDVTYKDLVDSVSKFTKDISLLSGEATENVKIKYVIERGKDQSLESSSKST